MRTRIISLAADTAYTTIARKSIEIVVKTEGGASANTMRMSEDLVDFDVQAALSAILSKVKPQVEGMDASDIRKVDETLRLLEKESPEIRPFVPSISQAVFEAAAKEKGEELYACVSQYSGLEPQIPLFVSTAIGSSLNFGDPISYEGTPYWCFVITKCDDAEDGVNALWLTQKSFEKKIKEKFHVKMSVHNGNLFYPEEFFPTIESLLDLMVEAIKDAGTEGKAELCAFLDGDSRYDRKTGLYRGVVSKSSTKKELIEKLLSLKASYPLKFVVDPLADEDSADVSIIEKSGLVVFGDNANEKADIFDTLTVSEAALVASKAASDGKLFLPVYSQSQGFKGMEYLVGFRAAAYFRSGLVDFGNRAIELGNAGVPLLSL